MPRRNNDNYASYVESILCLGCGYSHGDAPSILMHDDLSLHFEILQRFIIAEREHGPLDINYPVPR